VIKRLGIYVPSEGHELKLRLFLSAVKNMGTDATFANQ